MKPLDLIGQRFGRFVVLSRAPNQRGNTRWLVQCDQCGVTLVRSPTQLHGSAARAGKKQRCGHFNHGTVGTPEYQCWTSMKARCYSPSCGSFAAYGGRGITICDRWLNSFENFLADMGQRPSDGHSLDRIDVNGNYEPSNCRWATSDVQSRNTRRVCLTVELVAVMRAKHADGARVVDLARQHNVSESAVRHAIAGETWKEVRNV